MTQHPSGLALRDAYRAGDVDGSVFSAPGPQGVAAPDSIEAVKAHMREVPLHRHAGFDVIQRGPHAVLTMPLSDDVRGAGTGTVHGGMLAVLADVTCAMALWGTFDADTEIPVTTDMQVRYFRQPRSGPLRAEADLVHAGRRILSVVCSIVDDDERQLVQATASYMIMPRPTETSPR